MGSLWGFYGVFMGSYGGVQRPMGPYGVLPRFMGSCEALWGPTGSFGVL